jgi:arabinogalactan oligomer/maltooligosaccharide transport system permease protein
VALAVADPGPEPAGPGRGAPDRGGRGGTEPGAVRFADPGSTSLSALAGKLLVLGLAAALAVWAAFPLVEARAWGWLAGEVGVVALIFYVYLSRRRLPAKYLVPGTLLLIAFQIVPVLYTASTAFTNFGDGRRGAKADAVAAIQRESLTQVPGSTEYSLRIATTGDPQTGPLVFLLLDPQGRAFVGDARGLREAPAGEVTVDAGRITAARGYTILNLGQVGARSAEIEKVTVPTAGGGIRSQGTSQAFELAATRRYDAGCDCVRDTATGREWRADEADGSFVAADGDRLPQGWQVTVGARNFLRVLTDPGVARPFFGALVWNLAFAVGSVLATFAFGLFCALALHSERLRGQRYYRVLLVLPYAMPSFAMLLVWRDMFNADFGLINRVFDLDVDWLGGTWTARFVVILVQLWLGYPYMFLVATGALQAIPREVGEAAAVDGASPWQQFRQVTLPLLLVALSPLLISSFAYNFNNFNAIYLTTEGGPFPADNPNVGATDLLITYTYRLVFGGQGAQYGFAAAVSIYIFLIVATISTVAFRRTRKQEEVYS